MPRRSTKCCKDVVPENAARVFDTPAPILKHKQFTTVLECETPVSVIEYGPGALRNANYLIDCGLVVTVVDLKQTIERFEDRYTTFQNKGGRVWSFESMRKRACPKHPSMDLAVCTFVLGAICDPAIRDLLLRDCRARLRLGKPFFLSTRGASDVLTINRGAQPCSDGYITPNRTFVRPFTISEISALLHKSGFDDITPLHRPGFNCPELVHVIAR